MPSVVLEFTISAGERPQTYALDRAATGTRYFQRKIVRTHTYTHTHTNNLSSFFPPRCSVYIFGLLVGRELYILFVFETPDFLGSK